MTTLISSEHGRCDARCYNGKPETKCVCICEGKNHAKGLIRALENTRENFEDIPEEAAKILHPVLNTPEATVVFQRRGEPNTVGDALIFVRFGDGTRSPIRHLVKHSPTGMNFGYGGSGPADAARSILAYFYGPQVADRLYMDFKWKFIGGIDQEKGGELSFNTIDTWVKNHQRFQEVGHAS